MQDETITFLSVRGLATIFLVGRLDVENQQNGRGGVPVLLHVISFCLPIKATDTS
jgi:hypothetical protein